MQVLVRDNNVDQALKALKKKMQREGIFREMKLRGHYEKPSEKKAREKAEAIRRARKLARKRVQREGLLPMKPKPVAGGPAAAAAARSGPPRRRASADEFGRLRRICAVTRAGSPASVVLTPGSGLSRYSLVIDRCREPRHAAVARSTHDRTSDRPEQTPSPSARLCRISAIAFALAGSLALLGCASFSGPARRPRTRTSRPTPTSPPTSPR